jgi:hypothetical protein
VDSTAKLNSSASSTSNHHKTQRDAILGLLVRARGAWVPLPKILELGCAQYNARIFELRRLGFHIENRGETRDGVRHTFFRLVIAAHPKLSNAANSQHLPPSGETGLLFELPGRPHRDDN